MKMRFLQITFAVLFLALGSCSTPLPDKTVPPIITMAATKEMPSLNTAIPLPAASPTSQPAAEKTSALTLESNFVNSHIDQKYAPIGHNFPRIAGSTSTEPLWMEIICSMYAVYCRWQDHDIQPELHDNLRDQLYSFVWSHFAARGTHQAYTALISGTADIILVARAPSPDELAFAHTKGITLDVRPVALDAFVFLVNSQNTVDNLSLEQIRGIYSGKITNWKQIGGADGKIQAYQRDENSGSQELMETLVMKSTPVISAPEMILYTMEGPFTTIGGFPPAGDYAKADVQGIGYSVYFYTKNMVNTDNIETIGVNGVEPTSATIADQSYPLTAEVYVVVRATSPSNSPEVLLRDWLLTADGQNTVYWSGYVPIK
jgi:phosphate transport system substrate-binding protein